MIETIDLEIQIRLQYRLNEEMSCRPSQKIHGHRNARQSYSEIQAG
jgi:hypothetical protein